MAKYKGRHNIWFKIIAMAMVCLFLVNDVVWAHPDENLSKSTLAVPSQLTKEEFKKKFLAKASVLMHPAANEALQALIMIDKKIFKERWEKDRTAELDVSNPNIRGNIKARVEGLTNVKLVRVTDLFKKTGQFAHVGLSGRYEIDGVSYDYGMPVIYIDALYHDKASKTALRHEIDEIIQWEELRSIIATVYGIDRNQVNMREWIKAHIGESDKKLDGTKYQDLNSIQVAECIHKASYTLKGLYKFVDIGNDKNFFQHIGYDYIGELYDRYIEEEGKDVNIAASNEDDDPTEKENYDLVWDKLHRGVIDIHTAINAVKRIIRANPDIVNEDVLQDVLQEAISCQRAWGDTNKLVDEILKLNPRAATPKVLLGMLETKWPLGDSEERYRISLVPKFFEANHVLATEDLLIDIFMHNIYGAETVIKEIFKFNKSAFSEKALQVLINMELEGRWFGAGRNFIQPDELYGYFSDANKASFSSQNFQLVINAMRSCEGQKKNRPFSIFNRFVKVNSDYGSKPNFEILFQEISNYLEDTKDTGIISYPINACLAANRSLAEGDFGERAFDQLVAWIELGNLYVYESVKAFCEINHSLITKERLRRIITAYFKPEYASLKTNIIRVIEYIVSIKPSLAADDEIFDLVLQMLKGGLYNDTVALLDVIGALNTFIEINPCLIRNLSHAKDPWLRYIYRVLVFKWPFINQQMLFDGTIEHFYSSSNNDRALNHLFFYRSLIDPKFSLASSPVVFPYHDKGQNIIAQAQKVVIIHNIKDGQGDELIRNARLVQSLLEFNSTLQVVIYTDREFLYSHPRVETRNIKNLHKDDIGKCDIIIHHYDKGQRYSDAVEAQVQEYLKEVDFKAQPRHLYIRTDKSEDLFNYAEVILDGEYVDLPDYKGNVYVPAYILLSELGIPFYVGTDPRKASLFVSIQNETTKKIWQESVDSKRNGRRVALFAGSGGENMYKGYHLEDFTRAVQDIIKKGYFVVIMRNGQEGEAASLEMTKRLLSPDELAMVYITPPIYEDPLLPKYFMSYSDAVVSVEGGMVHLAYNMGKPLYMLFMRTSGNPLQWFPAGADRYQIMMKGMNPRSVIDRDRLISQTGSDMGPATPGYGGKGSPAKFLETVRDNLLTHALSENGFAFKDIAALREYSSGTVYKEIRILMSLGILEKVKVGGKTMFRFSAAIRALDAKHVGLLIDTANNIEYNIGRKNKPLDRYEIPDEKDMLFVKELVRNVIDIEKTQYLSDILPPTTTDEVKYYVVRYNDAKLRDYALKIGMDTDSFKRLLNMYVRILRVRLGGKERVELKPSSGVKQPLISIECYNNCAKTGVPNGIGRVDIDGQDIDRSSTLRIIDMANIAFAVSSIPLKSKIGELDQYSRLISFIQNQYKELTGKDISLQEILRDDRLITLPSIRPIPFERLKEYYEFTIRQLEQAA